MTAQQHNNSSNNDSNNDSDIGNEDNCNSGNCGGGSGNDHGIVTNDDNGGSGDRGGAKIWDNLAIWKSLPESGMGVPTPMLDFLEIWKFGNMEIWKSVMDIRPILQRSGNEQYEKTNIWHI